MKHRFIAVTESEAHVQWLEESLGPLAEAVIADDSLPIGSPSSPTRRREASCSSA